MAGNPTWKNELIMDELTPRMDVDVVADADLANDIALVLSGIHLPLAGRLQLVSDDQFTTDGPLLVTFRGAFPADLAALRLIDEESTPVASIAPVSVDTDYVTGTLAPLGRATATAATPWLVTPAEFLARTHGTPVRAFLCDRPLSEARLAAIRLSWSDHLVLLLAAVGGQDALVPDGILLAALEAAAATLPRASVAAIPLSRRNIRSGTEAALATQFGAATTNPGLPDSGASGAWPYPDEPWSTVLAALDDDRELGSAVAPAGARAIVRSWRAPRSTRGFTVLFTGFSGSGKSTVAAALVARLEGASARKVSVLDGDRVRRLLSAGLGFSPADRDLNVRRIGYVATEVTRHGGIAVCAPIAPYAATRAWIRSQVGSVGDLFLVHVATPLEVCEARDRKGLYAAARRGEIPNFTGISDVYETPTDAELTIDTSVEDLDSSVERVLAMLVNGGWLPA